MGGDRCGRSLAWRRTAAGEVAVRLASFVPLLCIACSHPPGPPPIEDKARRDVPIAICRKALTSADTNDAGAPRAEAYWSVALPGFHGFGAPIDPSRHDCAGNSLSAGSGQGTRTSPPIASDDSTLTPDESGLQAVWLRPFRTSDRVAAGPLVLARPRPAELDVYAIGDYTGSARHSRFEFARLGATLMIVTHDDGCADVKVDSECQSVHGFYLKAGGRLVLAATTPAQRVQYGTLKDLGRVQFRLTTEGPIFEARSVTVKERLSVRDAGGEEVRKVEGDRVFALRDDGTLAASQDTVWSQVAGGVR
jgi:hypothetical protein